jgi:hypothetical protein
MAFAIGGYNLTVRYADNRIETHGFQTRVERDEYMRSLKADIRMLSAESVRDGLVAYTDYLGSRAS